MFSLHGVVPPFPFAMPPDLVIKQHAKKGNECLSRIFRRFWDSRRVWRAIWGGGLAMYSKQSLKCVEQLGGAVLGKWLHKFIGWFLFGYPHLISTVKGTKGQIIIHAHKHLQCTLRAPTVSSHPESCCELVLGILLVAELLNLTRV